MSNRSRRASRSPDKSVIKIRTEKNGFGNSSRGNSRCWCCFNSVFYLLYLIFAWISGVFMLIAFILSVISCIFLLSSNRSPASKAVWIFIILIFFRSVIFFISCQATNIFSENRGNAIKRFSLIPMNASALIPSANLRIAGLKRISNFLKSRAALPHSRKRTQNIFLPADCFSMTFSKKFQKPKSLFLSSFL